MSTDQLTRRIRALKIIIAAMASGLFAVAVIVVALVTSGSMKVDDRLAPTMLIVLGGLAVCEAVGYVVFRQGIIGKTRLLLREHADDDQSASAVTNAFAVLTIVAGAMLEGLGLFGAVIMLVTAEQLALIGPALAILLLLAFVLPTEEKARNFASTVMR